MYKVLIAAAVLALTLVGGPLLATDGFSLKDKPKPAWLYFSVRNDGGWQQAFEEARVKMEAALDVKIPYVDGVGEDEKLRCAQRQSDTFKRATT